MRKTTTACRFAIACLCTVALVCAASARAAYVPPQVQSLEALRSESAIPLRVDFRGGFPVHVVMDITRPGGVDPAAAAEAYLAEFADFYGLDHPAVQLAHVRTDDAPGGGQLVRFSQTLGGFPVLGAELQVHVLLDADIAHITGSTGAMVQPATTDTDPAVETEMTLAPALSATMAEEAARADVGVPDALIAGETRLMIHDPRLLTGEGLPRLVWRVTLGASGVRQLVIDANTGEVLLSHSLLDNDDNLEDWDLQLDDAAWRDAGVSCFWFSNTYFLADEGGVDPELGGQLAVDAAMAWWGARNTYEMFHELWGRHSYDDDDAQLEVYLRASVDNASGGSWCGIQFRDGWVAQDILAHEYGHLVIDETSDFGPYFEPGSLNESFADIIGVLLDSADWLLGEESLSVSNTPPGFVRHFQNPPARKCGNNADGGFPPIPCPDRYSQYMVASPTEAQDNGGVHWNANIINKAFYLLMSGGTFNGRLVLPMGRAKAGRLAYASFTGLNSGAWFMDLRQKAVDTAHDFATQGLHGFIAADVCSVRNAFRAVELGEGDGDCDGVEDNVDDQDGDGVLDDGDSSGNNNDTPCIDNWIWGCDDNCTDVPNPTQADFDDDGDGDLCDDDDDNDGTPDWIDFCPSVPGLPIDSDGDGVRDCLDDDDDNDGIPDDGDGSGDPFDNPCPSGVTADCDDNCQATANPTQFDGDGNGFGDACDPDNDGDGVYADDDNCPFTSNSDQADADGDGLGDVCDKCPGVEDHDETDPWHPGIPGLGIDPYPVQPDADGDGIPDACDPTNWGETSISNSGSPYSMVNPIWPDDAHRTVVLTGPPGAGNRVRLVFPACDTPSRLMSMERVELVLTGLPESVNGWVEDDSGRPVARIRVSSMDPGERGLRFRPRCDRRYALTLLTEDGFPGNASFGARATAVIPTPGHNRWTSTPAVQDTPPTLPPDQDGDGLRDEIDRCPMDYDPENRDADMDGTGDVCDNCPDVANPAQQQAEIHDVRATSKTTFAWPDSHQFDWILGYFDSSTVDSPREGGKESGYEFEVPLSYRECEGCWFLWKPACGAGTWGTTERDGVIPQVCNDIGDCPEDRVCVDGLCKAGFDLNVSKIGLGTGVVSSTPAGIDCGDDCTQTYLAGTTVELSATTLGDSIFIGWSGDCTGLGSCEVTMSESRVVTANFAPPELLLTVIKLGSGTGRVTSSPVGISCGDDCTEIYPTGTMVSLTAFATPPSAFAGWSGPCTGTGVCTFVMNSLRTAKATFSIPSPSATPDVSDGRPERPD